jgi:hypothetical protein
MGGLNWRTLASVPRSSAMAPDVMIGCVSHRCLTAIDASIEARRKLLFDCDFWLGVRDGIRNWLLTAA